MGEKKPRQLMKEHGEYFTGVHASCILTRSCETEFVGMFCKVVRPIRYMLNEFQRAKVVITVI